MVLKPTVLCKPSPFVKKTIAEGKHNASVCHARKTVLVSNHNGFITFYYDFLALLVGQNVVVYHITPPFYRHIKVHVEFLNAPT